MNVRVVIQLSLLGMERLPPSVFFLTINKLYKRKG